MDTTVRNDMYSVNFSGSANSTNIIKMAEEVGLDSGLLYEAVIDLSSDGLLTANSINFAAGILLRDLGLPGYFFAQIKKAELKQLLKSIALNADVENGKAVLLGQVAVVDFSFEQGVKGQRVTIATEETRDNMESLLEPGITGHRRDYYFHPETNYYTYIIRSESLHDYPAEQYVDSPFLYRQVGDYSDMPKPTRQRYDSFLSKAKDSAIPLIQAFNLPETGEVRLMFVTDFESPQLPAFRKIMNDQGYPLVRAYWEPFYSENSVSSSVCSLYLKGELTRNDEALLIDALQDFLSCADSPGATRLYLEGKLTFKELLFTVNAIDFTHFFIFKESVNEIDLQILDNLVDKDHQDAFAKRIQDSNKSTYGTPVINEAVRRNPDLIKELFEIFDERFNPAVKSRLTDEELEIRRKEFERKIHSRFIDYPVGFDIFKFMFKIVSCTLKTNFYVEEKRSYSFRFDNRVLDPLVFTSFVYGIFYVNGHYCSGIHMRADDIARGGLRLIRVNRSNYEAELDGAVLLNYALGPKAQRIKHKDICESGSKGVIIPHPAYADCSLEAILDYSEGIMDLIQFTEREVIDYYGRAEMVFFGPDEGTASLMDAVSLRSRELGYKYWRTLTTGKSFGIPHDTYGLLDSGECFGLFDRGNEGVELQIEGNSCITTRDMSEIYSEIGERIAISGMTTGSVMSSFRTLIAHYKTKEEELNLMITGGPDGDLGANEIQCYRGRICLIIDGGSVLFDPEGLDKEVLRNLAFSRNSVPRLNSLAYPFEKLSKEGFIVPLGSKDVSLPDGTVVEDGTLFHRTFLTNPVNRKYIKRAKIGAFIPCGGFKDTINQFNIQHFLENFGELRFIVEGANIFFDDSARRYIATETEIKQIKDSSANKGGVFSSSIAEVLTGFLLGDRYEADLENEAATKWGLIRDIMNLVQDLARDETEMLLQLHKKNPDTPLFVLSERSSEEIFELQAKLVDNLDSITDNSSLMGYILEQYVPAVLIEKIGMERIGTILNSSELAPYRNAIVSKKLASLAYYRFGTKWESFVKKIDSNIGNALNSLVLN